MWAIQGPADLPLILIFNILVLNQNQRVLKISVTFLVVALCNYVF